jgi:hypothetical protein
LSAKRRRFHDDAPVAEIGSSRRNRRPDRCQHPHPCPVGPNDTILATFGSKRAIAFYEAYDGRCAVNAIVYDKTDAETGMTTAARVRVSLDPREMVQIDSTDNETMSLQCGDRAETLTVIDPHAFIAAGAAH